MRQVCAAWARRVGRWMLSPAYLEGNNPVWSLWISVPIIGLSRVERILASMFISRLSIEISL